LRPTNRGDGMADVLALVLALIVLLYLLGLVEAGR
jgi:hypothetical protein